MMLSVQGPFVTRHFPSSITRYGRLIYQRGAIACAVGALLAGCGGGGAQATNPVAPYVPPPTSATTTQSIAPSGGTITTTFSGQAVTVTVPAGALAAATSVTVSVYVPSAAPKTIASRQRSPKDLPSDVIPVLEMQVDAGTAPLLKPLKVSAAVAPPPVGSVYRLA